MTSNEQTAFVNAYAKNVASVPRDRVADFVARYESGEDIEYSEDYTSIMDALCVWYDAMKYAKQDAGTQ
jgi:hypothetical protein